MSKKIYASLMALAMMTGGLAAEVGRAQTRRVAASASTQVRPGLLASLPSSDAVMQVDVQRLLNDALPKVFAGNSTRLAQVNTEIDQFKARTGIDVRSFDRIALGMRFRKVSEQVTTTSTVVLAHGSFNAGAIVAAGRLAAKGQYREERYNGSPIYIFSMNDQVKMLGLLNMRVRDLAVASLDANTLAMGDLEPVQAAIDASKGQGRVAAELVQLATRNPNAIVGFGANLPPSIAQSLRINNDEIARNVSSIRQVYGSIGTTAKGFDTLAVARTETQDQARNLSDTLSALRQFGGLLVAKLRPPTDKVAQNALENLQITTQGNELQLRLEIPQDDISALMRGAR